MKLGETPLSFYRNCKVTTPGRLTLKETLLLQKGEFKETIERIRKSKSKEEKDSFKRNLPAVTFGGEFQGRNKLIKASGLACLDFDKVQGLGGYKDALKASEYILSYWLSPSGNGFKALVRIPEVKTKKEYQERYQAILSHFKELTPDEATKDITRLCFLSYDADLYVNKDAKIFTERFKKDISTYKSFSPNEISNDLPEGKIVDRLIQWWVKKYSFSNGSRNNSLFVLACSFSTFGISKSTTENVFQSFEDKDFSNTEIQTLINSAYRKADFNSKSFPQ